MVNINLPQGWFITSKPTPAPPRDGSGQNTGLPDVGRKTSFISPIRVQQLHISPHSEPPEVCFSPWSAAHAPKIMKLTSAPVEASASFGVCGWTEDQGNDVPAATPTRSRDRRRASPWAAFPRPRVLHGASRVHRLSDRATRRLQRLPLHVRIQSNYVHAHRNSTGGANIFQMRFQVDL